MDHLLQDLRTAIVHMDSTRVDLSLASGLMNHLKEWASIGTVVALLILVSILALWCQYAGSAAMTGCFGSSSICSPGGRTIFTGFVNYSECSSSRSGCEAKHCTRDQLLSVSWRARPIACGLMPQVPPPGKRHRMGMTPTWLLWVRALANKSPKTETRAKWLC